MNQRLILLIGIFSIYGMKISNAGIVQDLETANKIPDEQWIEKSKAFVTAFENLKVKLQEQWRMQLGNGSCGIPINGVYPNTYNPDFISERGAVKEDSPVVLSNWLNGFVGLSASRLPVEKRAEITGCCTPYRWEVCCTGNYAWTFHLLSILFCPCTFGLLEAINYATIDTNDQAEAYMKHARKSIKAFIIGEFNVTSLQAAGQHLQRHFCVPIANLILKVLDEESDWTKEKLIPLLQMYYAYVSCDAGFGRQKEFGQYKFTEVHESIHQFLAKIICTSSEGNEELNAWLGKQLANWRKDPYSSIAGLGQYQIEVEFLLETAGKIHAQEGSYVAQNLANIINIVIDEIVSNRQVRARYRQQQAEINNAYLMGLAMRNGAGVY